MRSRQFRVSAFDGSALLAWNDHTGSMRCVYACSYHASLGGRARSAVRPWNLTGVASPAHSACRQHGQQAHTMQFIKLVCYTLAVGNV